MHDIVCLGGELFFLSFFFFPVYPQCVTLSLKAAKLGSQKEVPRARSRQARLLLRQAT
jgi:hypothetical protein